jgi:hypothetical protein
VAYTASASSDTVGQAHRSQSINVFGENLLTLFVSSVASLQAQKFFSVLNWSNLQKYVFFLQKVKIGKLFLGRK